jgi:hypothetical protein
MDVRPSRGRAPPPTTDADARVKKEVQSQRLEELVVRLRRDNESLQARAKYDADQIADLEMAVDRANQHARAAMDRQAEMLGMNGTRQQKELVRLRKLTDDQAKQLVRMAKDLEDTMNEWARDKERATQERAGLAIPGVRSERGHTDEDTMYKLQEDNRLLEEELDELQRNYGILEQQMEVLQGANVEYRTRIQKFEDLYGKDLGVDGIGGSTPASSGRRHRGRGGGDDGAALQDMPYSTYQNSSEHDHDAGIVRPSMDMDALSEGEEEDDNVEDLDKSSVGTQDEDAAALDLSSVSGMSDGSSDVRQDSDATLTETEPETDAASDTDTDTESSVSVVQQRGKGKGRGKHAVAGKPAEAAKPSAKPAAKPTAKPDTKPKSGGKDKRPMPSASASAPAPAPAPTPTPPVPAKGKPPGSVTGSLHGSVRSGSASAKAGARAFVPPRSPSPLSSRSSGSRSVSAPRSVAASRSVSASRSPSPSPSGSDSGSSRSRSRSRSPSPSPSPSPVRPPHKSRRGGGGEDGKRKTEAGAVPAPAPGPSQEATADAGKADAGKAQPVRRVFFKGKGPGGAAAPSGSTVPSGATSSPKPDSAASPEVAEVTTALAKMTITDVKRLKSEEIERMLKVLGHKYTSPKVAAAELLHSLGGKK